MLVARPDVDASLELWAATSGGRARLINLSENHTYFVEAPAGRSVLRLHRPGYQSRAAIESELAWLAALRGRLPVPAPLAGRDGCAVQETNGRFAVLFGFEAGVEPAEDAALAPLFGTLGRYAATLHRQAETWRRPAGFTRQRWDAGTILDANGLWGDWRAAPGVAADVRAALDRVDARLRERLTAYGTGPDRYGLVHADMRLANLLVDGERVTLIDFDDCGFCWFVYDLAASLSFIEMRSDLDQLIAAWCAGYADVRGLSQADLDMIGPMILLRRMALLAWIGSHGETNLARRHAPNLAADTVALAGRLPL